MPFHHTRCPVRALAALMVAVALLTAPAAPAVAHAVDDPVRAVTSASAKKQVEARNDKLLEAVNAGQFQKAKKYADEDVIDFLKGFSWITDGCYRTSENPDDEVEYAGSQPWGCNWLTDGAYVALGFGKKHGKFKALDLQGLAS